jgi:SSS family solute:Na+ symporter
VSLVMFVAVGYVTRDSYGSRSLDEEGHRTIVAGGDDSDE